MAFENDPEAHAIAVRYAGRDFDKPRIITHTVFDMSGDETWSLEEFNAALCEVIPKIPSDRIKSAVVTLQSGDEFSPGRLFISYEGQEDPNVVSARIESCRLQIERERAKDLATYQRLKKKFEGDAG